MSDQHTPRAPRREKKWGRPKLDRSDVRENKIHVRLNDAELSDVQDRAASAGMELATFMRTMAVNGRVVLPAPESHRLASAELAAIGADLKRLTTMTLKGMRVPLGESVDVDMITSLRAEIDKVSLMLLGADK